MDDVEAFKKAIMLGRGDEVAGIKIKKKGVAGINERSDHFGFWMEDDGFLSLPNAIAKLRPTVPKYVCAHCGVESPKDEWGPGLVTCPRCGKFAPSAAEASVCGTCAGRKKVTEFIDKGASGYDAERPCPVCTKPKLKKIYQYSFHGRWQTIRGDVEVTENQDGSLSCRTAGGRSTFEQGAWRMAEVPVDSEKEQGT